MQIRKLKTKMGFLVLAKHGLNKYGIKRPKLVSFFLRRENRREREGEKRRREEGRASKAKLQKGMEPLTLSMELGFLVWILGFVW